MSDARQESILDIISVLNSILQLIARSNQAALELMAYFERIRAEGREPTDAELDDLRQKSIEARDRLLSG